MNTLPPFILVFDISALLTGRTRDWQEFTRVGECVLPQAVFDRLHDFCDRAPDSDTERVAREFNRFYPDSGWKKTIAVAEHPSLHPAEGHTLSKKARLSLTVLQCVYGIAQRRTDALVVLVADDHALIQRLFPLKQPNLCGIPVTSLLQWSRTQRRPPVVTTQLHTMRTVVGATASSTPTTHRSSAVRPSSRSIPAHSAPVTYKRQSSSQETARRFTQSLSSVLVLVFVAIAILAIWRFAHPPSFNQFWQKLPIVEQPKNPTPAKR